MKTILKLNMILLVILLLSGCFKERIELDLNAGDNKKVVITAWITDLDEPQSVLLNYSSDYFDSLTVAYINGAEVSLSDGSEDFILEFEQNGLYVLPQDWRGEQGKTYTLSVRHNNVEYTATNTMRLMPEIEDVYTAFSLEQFEEDSIITYEIFFSFREVDGEGDGYFGIDFLKGTKGGDTLVNGGFIDDEFIDGEYFDDVSLTDRIYSVGDTAILEVHSIGKDASRFLQDIIDETFRDGLFDPTPVNVRSNFTNGAVGYFVTSCSRRMEVIIEN